MGALMQEVVTVRAAPRGRRPEADVEGSRIRYAGPSAPSSTDRSRKRRSSSPAIRSSKSRPKRTPSSSPTSASIHCDGADVPNSEIEVRQVSETRRLSRRPAEKAGGWRDQEQSFRDRLARLEQKRNTTMRFMMLMIPNGYETAKPGTMPDVRLVER